MAVGTSGESEGSVDLMALFLLSASRRRADTSAACEESSGHESLVMKMPFEARRLTISSMLSENDEVTLMEFLTAFL